MDNDYLLDTLYLFHTNWKSRKIQDFHKCVICESEEQYYELLDDERFNMFYTDNDLSVKFKQILNPFFNKDHGKYAKKKIYCRLESCDSEPQKGKYSFSAMTKEMIEADKLYYDPEKDPSKVSILDLLYKPYLYELAFDCDLRIVEKLLRKSADNNDLKLENGAWYTVTISPDECTNDYVDENSNKPYSEFYGYDSYVDQEYKTGIKATLLYSASKPQSKRVIIERIEQINTKIENELNANNLVQKDISTKNKAEVDAELDKLFADVVKSHVKVLRVGQANAVYITNTYKDNHETSFAFDLGLPIDSVIDKNANNTGIVDDDYKKMMDRSVINPAVLIISHWHSDHFRGLYVFVRRMLKGNYRIKIIAPRYIVDKKNYYKTDNLVKYLIKNQSIVFTEDDYSYSCLNPNDNRIYRLMRIKAVEANDNDNCLVLQMNNTLLPGDCSYDKWPDEFGMDNGQNKMPITRNILVTHHAAADHTQLIRNKLSTIKDPAISPRKAIVCVGQNNYNHPSKPVEKAYEDEGFSVYETKNGMISSAEFNFDVQ